MTDQLYPCPSWQCVRKVASQGTYCCGECRTAWESSHRFEPHEHSAGCDRRHELRTQTGEAWPAALFSRESKEA